VSVPSTEPSLAASNRRAARRRALLGVAAAVVALIVAGALLLAAVARGTDDATIDDQQGAPAEDPVDEGAGDDGEAVDTDDTTDEGEDPDADEPGADDPDADDPDGTADDDGTAAHEDEPRGRLVIDHVGDVNLDPDYHPYLRTAGPEAVWDGVRDTFAEADLVLANLECTASELGSPEPKQFTFRCDLDALPAMRDAGVDVASLANNHSGDFGMDAMVDGVPNVEAAGMIPVGVGRDEAEAYAPGIVEVQGWRVAVLGFGGVVPEPWWHARGDTPGQATGYDAERMAAAVAAVRDDADLVLATVHWGTEGSFEPRPEDVRKAEAMIAAGADIVVGHHAHRLQPLEVVDGAPVAWGLGNFVWPSASPDANRTAVSRFVVEPDGSIEACLLPFEISAQGVPTPTGADPTCTAAATRGR
jgi:hypothetical protein